MGITLGIALLALQVGDPQLGTDHPYFPGEKALSTPAAVMAHANAVPRGSLGASTDREKLIRLFLWRAEHYAHLYSPAVYNLPGVTPDPTTDHPLMIDYDAMRSLFSYGYGLCGTNHAQMRPFIEAYGWIDRRRGLQGDTGYEVFVDGAWRYVNTDQYTLHFLGDSPGAHFASLDQVVSTNHRYLEWNPDLGLGYRLPQANTHGNYQDFPGVTGTVPNRSLQWRDYYANVWNIAPASSIRMYGEGYTAAPVRVRLRRGETFTRWLSPDGAVSDLGLTGRAWWGHKGAGGPFARWSFVQNAPARDETPGGAEESQGLQRYGNGCFDWQPSLAAGEHLDGAAVVTGTLVAGGTPALRSTGASTLVLEHYTPYTIAARPADGVDPAGPASDGARISGTATGSLPVEVSVNAGATWTAAGVLSGSGAVDFTDLVKGRNQYLLRISFDDAEGLSSLRVRTLTMLSQAVYPNLKDGTTQVTYSAGGRGVLDLSPDLWTSASADSLTGFVVKEADSGNLAALHYAGGSTWAYESTNNQPVSITYKITLPPALAAAGATWAAVSAAANVRVRVPPAGGPASKIEVAAAPAGPWTQIGEYAPPADNELSSYWVDGRTVGALGGTVQYVRFTTYNGGYTSGFRFLRLYGTYALPAPGAPLTVTYHWNDGSERSSAHVVPAGTTADAWSVAAGTGVAQRKVVMAVGTSTPSAPSIVVQPSGQTVTEGGTATFSVVATGTVPLQYQWRRNGADLPGATSSSVTTPATILADDGALYSVVVSNGSGSVTSSDARLTVRPAGAGGGGSTTVVLRNGSDGYAGTTDTHVDEFQPTTSFGALDRLEIRWYDDGSGPSEHQRTLIRFDLSSIPAGAAVTSAKLIVHNTRATANSAADVVHLERVTSAWTDATTWNTRPSTAATGISCPGVAGYTLSPVPPEVYEVGGLESLVQGWLSTPSSNHGVMLFTAGNLNFRLASSEYATTPYRPALEITYATSGGGGAGAPTISSPPSATTAVEGSTATFSVGVGGSGPFAFQWRRNGTDVPGATSASYTTPVLSLADDGALYSVVVTSAGGSTIGGPALLTVTPAGGGAGGGPAPAAAAEGNDEDQKCSCGSASPGAGALLLAGLLAGILWIGVRPR